MSQHTERPRLIGRLRRHRVRTIAASIALVAIAVFAGAGFTDCPPPAPAVPGVAVAVGPADVSIGTGTSCGQCQPGLVGVTNLLCNAQPQGLLAGVSVNVPGVSVDVGGPWSGCGAVAAPAPQVVTTLAAPPAAPPAVTHHVARAHHHTHHRAHVSASTPHTCGCYYPSIPSIGAYVSVGAFLPSIQVGVSL